METKIHIVQLMRDHTQSVCGILLNTEYGTNKNAIITLKLCDICFKEKKVIFHG